MTPAEEPLKDVIAQIESAFIDAPRPADAELLHPECRDDMDLTLTRRHQHGFHDLGAAADDRFLGDLREEGARHLGRKHVLAVHDLANRVYEIIERRVLHDESAHAHVDEVHDVLVDRKQVHDDDLRPRQVAP